MCVVRDLVWATERSVDPPVTPSNQWATIWMKPRPDKAATKKGGISSEHIMCFTFREKKKEDYPDAVKVLFNLEEIGGGVGGGDNAVDEED